jgi:TNF receptor-associated protein 1
LKHLGEEAKKDPEQYAKFYETFGMFLKEGATSDFTHRDAIAKLLRFESSKSEAGKMISLAEYVERMKEDQKEIYYINGPNRHAIESSPYLDTFKDQDIEIIYTMDPIDDFVFSHLGEFDEKKLISADRADLDIPKSKDGEDKDAKKDALDEPIVQTLTKWMKEVLGDKVKEVSESKRLVGSPAIVVNPDGFMTSTMERIMQAQSQNIPQPGGKNLEINTSHPLVKGLVEMRMKDEEFAKIIVAQILDNALIQTGLMTESREMVERNYKILERAVS